jgi:glycosyltransferase 2 family protein
VPWQRAITAIIVCLAVLAVGALIVRDGTVPGWEESVFRTVNDLPGALYPVLWPFQQLGVLVIGPIVAIVALILRRYRLAVAALIVTAAKLVSERIVKAAVSRERPYTSIGSDIHVRGDVSTSGESFVSGHAILVAALATVIWPYLPARWRPVLWVLVALVMIGRVYVGAHNPLDVVCGAALGVALGIAINVLLAAPDGHRHRAAVTADMRPISG